MTARAVEVERVDEDAQIRRPRFTYERSGLRDRRDGHPGHELDLDAEGALRGQLAERRQRAGSSRWIRIVDRGINVTDAELRANVQQRAERRDFRLRSQARSARVERLNATVLHARDRFAKKLRVPHQR